MTGMKVCRMRISNSQPSGQDTLLNQPVGLNNAVRIVPTNDAMV